MPPDFFWSCRRSGRRVPKPMQGSVVRLKRNGLRVSCRYVLPHSEDVRCLSAATTLRNDAREVDTPLTKKTSKVALCPLNQGDHVALLAVSEHQIEPLPVAGSAYCSPTSSSSSSSLSGWKVVWTSSPSAVRLSTSLLSSFRASTSACLES